MLFGEIPIIMDNNVPPGKMYAGRQLTSAEFNKMFEKLVKDKMHLKLKKFWQKYKNGDFENLDNEQPHLMGILMMARFYKHKMDLNET